MYLVFKYICKKYLVFKYICKKYLVFKYILSMYLVFKYKKVFSAQLWLCSRKASEAKLHNYGHCLVRCAEAKIPPMRAPLRCWLMWAVLKWWSLLEFPDQTVVLIYMHIYHLYIYKQWSILYSLPTLEIPICIHKMNWLK